MMRLPLLIVAVLLAAAVSSPAQSGIHQSRNHSSRSHVTAVVAPVPQLRDGRVGLQPPAAHGPRARRIGGDHRHAHGRWEVRYESVLVPGYWHVECVPPTYGWIYSHCGLRHWGIVDCGGERRTWVPPRWEQRPQRVWVRC